jgi:hypothetical protein
MVFGVTILANWGFAPRLRTQYFAETDHTDRAD